MVFLGQKFESFCNFCVQHPHEDHRVHDKHIPHDSSDLKPLKTGVIKHQFHARWHGSQRRFMDVFKIQKANLHKV